MDSDDYNVSDGSMYFDKTMADISRERKTLDATEEAAPVEDTVLIVHVDATQYMPSTMEDIAATTLAQTDMFIK
ncbi:hypothetical protein H4R24_005440, partial [Coemansia sp. RSA 988]